MVWHKIKSLKNARCWITVGELKQNVFCQELIDSWK